MSGALHAFFKNFRTPSVLLLHTLNNPNAYGTSANDFFADYVAISGNYAIVSAISEDEVGNVSSGKAYIFNVTTGALVHTLNNPNAFSTSQLDNFGNGAISGNYAIVGAALEDASVGAGEASGKAYIFNVTTGALVHTLNNPNAYGTDGGERFGESVDISGNYAIVGAYQESDASGSTSGKAYIFNVTTGALVHTLNNPNPYDTGVLDRFGFAVAISGNYAIVGAYTEDDAGGADSGKAYIFNVTTGALVHTLNNPNAYGTSASDIFGDAVAISGNYAVVCAPSEDDVSVTGSGKAYIYNVTTGALVHTLNNPNAYGTSASDSFGSSVAVSGDYAIIGASGEDDTGGTSSGKAYIFNVTTGALLHTLDNPNAYDTSASDYFGSSVSIADNYAIVGAYGEDDAGGTFSGKAYIYKTNLVSVLGAPMIGIATIASATSVNVTYTAPVGNGGSPITLYTATSSPGGITGTIAQAGSGTITVTGLTTGTAYTFTVTATTAVGTSPASVASNSVTPILLVGHAYQGGYYAGQISINGNGVATHNLVIGPKASAEAVSLTYKTTNTATAGTFSVIDGPTNSTNMNNASHPSAYFCKGVTTGGYYDWYLPAWHELEVIYFNLKPEQGNATYDPYAGINPNAVPARASIYTYQNPPQTSATIFKTGGAEAFSGQAYWASTSNTAEMSVRPYGVTAKSIRFSDGYTGGIYGNYKNFSGLTTRAVRRVAI